MFTVKRYLPIVWLSLAALAIIVSGTTAARAASLTLQPDPQLSPVQVVEFQLHALKHNNAAGTGIAATFRFASPANKEVTGPLARFSQLFKNNQYQPMINHQSADVELLANDNKTATLLASVVDQNGSVHLYRFRLSKQSDAPFTDCWMTDAVMHQPKPGRSA